MLSDVKLITKGFVYVNENEELLEEAIELAEVEISKNISKDTKKVDYNQIRNDVRSSLGRFFYHETQSKPMIITVIQEV